MCGIAGILTNRGLSADELEHAAGRMAESLAHRGPDDFGVWADHRAGVALGFRRLSVIDLTPLGHQPMRSQSGRYTVVFNGEIYNHGDLRHQLERGGWRFRGHSDTEVATAALECWGIEEAIKRFVGMFAIGIWDAEDCQLTLARDRLGIKPLFVYHSPGVVTFGSELKAIAEGPYFDGEISSAALGAYLRYLYVPAPLSIYRNVLKLEPGHLLSVTDPGQSLPTARPYWTAENAAKSGLENPFLGDETEAVEELERLLRESVGTRMYADVPVGALLSGGIDSSTVVALMSEVSTGPIETFTAGFDQEEHNEAPHAKRIADYLGTRHTSLFLTGSDALELVPRLPQLFDEPLADPSQIPTYLVCELARQHVTVALSGDGGDEVFGGYNRYSLGSRVIPKLLGLPTWVRRCAASVTSAFSPSWVDRLHRNGLWLAPSLGGQRLAGLKLQKLASLLREGSEAEMYRSLLSAWPEPQVVFNNGAPVPTALDRIMQGTTLPGLLDRMMLSDQAMYLPDDLLAKVDRASMSVSLEVRVPLLDHRIVEYSWRLPADLKIRDGTTKWILREVLYRRVPRALVDRPKVGFSVPIEQWLSGPLRDWAEDLLERHTLEEKQLFKTAAVQNAWMQFRKGRTDLALGLWTVLMFQAWSARWVAA